jgi:hypothetical protein
MIESFCAKPEKVRGSVTITNGVKVSAVARYLHIFSLFDRDYYGEGRAPQYFFTYQVRIRGPEPKTTEEN